MATPYDRKLVLETGEEFYGRGFGDARESVGEVVFDTTMVGYQEIVSDPAYAFQIVVMTYPVIGNYGISDDDFESRAPLAAGLVVRDYNDQPSNFRYTRTLAEVLEDSHIPGICEVDTRRLARLIRDGGSRRAHLDTTGTAKHGHTGNPGSLDFLRPAQQHDGLYDGRIGIFSQKNIPGAACLHSFFQLLRADHRLNDGKVWHIAALGYSTFLSCIHTR